jgi:hypothetical protein
MSREIAVKADNFSLEKYGRDDLQARWEITTKTLNELAPLHDIWDRQNSDWTLNNLTIPQAPPMRQIRQISAEIEHRSMALSEAKFSLLRKDLENKEGMRRLAEDELTPYERSIIELDISKRNEEIAFTLRKVSGAMRDVTTLQSAYDRISSQHGVPSLTRANEEEHEAAIYRAIRQSIRDVRQSGHIGAGNQEYLEQCGVNPSHALIEIRGYVTSELQSSGKKSSHDFAREFCNLVMGGGGVT